MHQLESFCAFAQARTDLATPASSSQLPLLTPPEAPLDMTSQKAVVEMPASLKPEDAVATAAGTNRKGKVIPKENLTETVASEPAMEGMPLDANVLVGGHDVPRPKDVAETNAIAKTSLCSYFRKRGCNHGENCKFAHGESELQMRPDGTWDPTSERCKKAVEKDEGEDGNGEDSKYRKCLVNVPMNWSQQKLKSFLDEKVSDLVILVHEVA